MKLRVLPIASALIALSMVGPPASGASAAPPLPTGGGRFDEALSRIEEVRAGLASGTLAEALIAASSLEEHRGIVSGRTEAPPRLGLPPGLEEPVGRLAAAVAAARTTALRARRGSPRAVEKLIGELDRIRALPRTEDGASPEIAALAARAARVADTDAIHSAAVLVARAIDRALPLLQAYALAQPRTHGDSARCDVLDVPTAICIGGTGPNEYPDDVALSIDLGGQDVYTNNAGGCTLFFAACVALDLEGNDRYETALPRGPLTVAQGGAVLGVGFLVDLDGDDRYVVTQPAPGAPTITGQAYAAFGVGVLADRGGNDHYGLSATHGAAVKGQGYAEFGSTTLLLDAEGDDTYLVQAAPEPAEDSTGDIRPGSATADGLGSGTIGSVGIVADAGGTDSFTVEALTSPILPSASGTQTGDLPAARSRGIGFAFYAGGTGLALTGDGPTTWTVRAVSGAHRSGLALADGLGTASAGGLGAVHDLGGDDTYSLEAISAASQTRSIQDGCACEVAYANVAAQSAQTSGQGTGAIGALGLLVDEDGNDAYSALATASGTAAAEDARSGAGTPGSVIAVAVSGEATAAGQGWGILGGAGLLRDLRGNDAYTSNATSEATARATSARGDTDLSSAAESKAARSTAQAIGTAGGYGELLDLGGEDRYTSINRSVAITEPDGGAAAGQAGASVQAAVTGVYGGVPPLPAAALLIDDGGQDVFVSQPAVAACVGTRGQDAWQDCGPGAGIGLNR